MNCEEAREARLDRASGPLEGDREQALARHAERCDACRAFVAEIDALELGIEDTLGAAATVEVARRFASRARWAPYAIAAALAVGVGLGALVAGPRPAEITVEVKTDVREDPVKRSHGAVGASVVAIGVVSGAVLLKMDGQETTVRAGEKVVAQARAPISLASPEEQAAKQAEAEKKIATLETALARSEQRATDLERKLAATGAQKAPGATDAEKKPSTEPSSQSGAAIPGTPDEKVRALVAKFDWKAGAEALVLVNKAKQKGTTSAIEPTTYLQLSRMQVVVAEIAKVRGYENPWTAFTDPLVLEEFYPSWLDALGVGLDETQRAAVKQHVHDPAEPKEKADKPASFLATLAKELEQKLADERSLGTILRPDQLQRFFESVGDDVLVGAHVDRSTHRSSTLEGLTENVLSEWKQTFELSPRSLDAAQPLARRYASDAAAIPVVDASADLAARRVAGARRAIAVALLEDRYQQELATLPVLTDEERARVKLGLHYLVDLQLKK